MQNMVFGCQTFVLGFRSKLFFAIASHAIEKISNIQQRKRNAELLIDGNVLVEELFLRRVAFLCIMRMQTYSADAFERTLEGEES